MDKLMDTQRDMMVAKETIDKTIQELVGQEIAVSWNTFKITGILEAFDGVRALINDGSKKFVIYIGPQMYFKTCEQIKPTKISSLDSETISEEERERIMEDVIRKKFNMYKKNK